VHADVLPELARARCFVAVRGSSLRIAPHLHITDEDVDRLCAALASAMHADPTGGAT
jgi:selenocysteine lyase/cysteine desulfurase